MICKDRNQKFSHNTEPLQHIHVEHDDDIQEVIPVKSEPISHTQDSEQVDNRHASNNVMEVEPSIENQMTMYDEGYANFETYEGGMANDTGDDPSMMVNADSNKGNKVFLNRYVGVLNAALIILFVSFTH